MGSVSAAQPLPSHRSGWAVLVIDQLLVLVPQRLDAPVGLEQCPLLAYRLHGTCRGRRAAGRPAAAGAGERPRCCGRLGPRVGLERTGSSRVATDIHGRCPWETTARGCLAHLLAPRPSVHRCRFCPDRPHGLASTASLQKAIEQRSLHPLLSMQRPSAASLLHLRRPSAALMRRRPGPTAASRQPARPLPRLRRPRAVL